MSDAVLTRDGPVAVPMDYTVPQGGELLPLTVRATIDGTSAVVSYYAVVQVIAPSGRVMGNFISTSIAAGASADVTWFRNVSPAAASSGTSIPTIETLLMSSRVSAGVTSTAVLQSGVSYLLTVQGTYSDWNEVLDVGSPEPDAIFPTSTSGRVSTQVGLDPETIFAYPSDHPHTIGHWTDFQMSLDGGSSWAHVEPFDGSHSTPTSDHLYTYSVTGQGHTVSFRNHDTGGPFTDNYGSLQIVIYGIPGGSSGTVATVTSSGGSINVTNPSGPTTNVDVAASGVTAATYGDATHVGQFHVGADGRVTSASNVAITGGSGVNSVTAADTSVVVGGTAADPTVRTGTLDVIAADHPPAADWSNNSKKITSLANGSAASDAAAFGQIPTSLPPSGSAGGNLTGTYPNPTIADVALLTTKGDLLGRGTSAPAARLGVGSDGQVLIADSTASLGLRWGSGSSSGSTVNTQTFTAGGGTWNKPAGVSLVEVVCIGPGGGGGAGGSSTAVGISGAGGGGAGGYSRRIYQASALPSSVTVTVPSGGGGGGVHAGAGGDAGTDATATTFGTLLKAGGGGGGAGGGITAGAKSGGGGGSAVNSGVGATGGAPTTGGSGIGSQAASGGTGAGGATEYGGSAGGGGSGNGAAGGDSIYGPTGGGGSGGRTSGGGAGTGGNGGGLQSYTSGSGAGGGGASTAGTDGTAGSGGIPGTGGGGGGGSATGSNGGKGGNGGTPGGGGGAGGYGNTGGAGGSGGDGFCIVVSW